MPFLSSLLLHPFSATLVVVFSCGLVALLTAGIFHILVNSRNPGTEPMQDFAGKVENGVIAMLRQNYGVLCVFVIVVGVVVYVFFDTTWSGVQTSDWQMPYRTGSLLLGVVCSLLPGYIGTRIATGASIRTTSTARTSLSMALRVAFLGGAATGHLVLGFSLLSLTGTLLFFTEYTTMNLASAIVFLPFFGAGASVVALFLHVGGGIAANAARRGAGLLRPAGIPEKDPRNPARVLRGIADALDVSAVSADAHESYLWALLAAILAASMTAWDSAAAMEGAMLLPVLLAALGAVASIFSTFAVRTGKGDARIHGALKNGVFFASALVMLGSFFFVQRMLASTVSFGVFLACAAGLIAGVIIGIFVEYSTSQRYKPVHALAETSRGGAAPMIASGLAIGFASTLLPLTTLIAALSTAYVYAGFYGISLSVVAMLSILGIRLAIDASAPIAANAHLFAATVDVPKQVLARTSALQEAASTAATMGKGFSIGATALTAIALFVIFVSVTKLQAIDLMHPLTFLALLAGSTLPFLCCSWSMHAVHRASFAMTSEMRQKTSEKANVKDKKPQLDIARMLRLLMSPVLRVTACVGVLMIIAPLVVGFTLGTEVLGSFLLGILVTGTLLAFAFVQSGGALRSALRYIEAGNLGGYDSDAHHAAVASGAVGDTLIEVAGPVALRVLKLAMIVAMLTAGLYSANGLY